MDSKVLFRELLNNIILNGSNVMFIVETENHYITGKSSVGGTFGSQFCLVSHQAMLTL